MKKTKKISSSVPRHPTPSKLIANTVKRSFQKQSQLQLTTSRLHTKKLKHTVIFITLIITLLAVQPFSLLKAQEQQNTSANQNQTQSTEKDNLCIPQMQAYAQERLEDFRQFMETHFQNKSSTVSLMDAAMRKYRLLQSELFGFYKQYFPLQDSSQFVVGAQPGSCFGIVETTLDDAEVLLRRHAMQTSGVKGTTALLEKYQDINGKLQNLVQQFSALKAALDAFAAKLPCYVKKGSCIQG